MSIRGNLCINQQKNKKETATLWFSSYEVMSLRTRIDTRVNTELRLTEVFIKFNQIDSK